MKKGLYLIFHTIHTDCPDGIEKKILKQKELFEAQGIQMQFIELQKLNGTFWNYKKEYADCDMIYFRKSTTIDYRFVSFFHKLKKDNPQTQIIMDIPTYPYEGEYGKGYKAKLKIYIDHIFRRCLSGYIDRIVVTGTKAPEKLWNIRTISIVNGIDVNNTIPAKIKEDKSYLSISCIAKFSPWHGYERLLYGLWEYRKKKTERKIVINMVGEGEELEYYQNLSEQLGLSNEVIFRGKLTGDALDRIYDETDIGCCSLGRYKSGHNVIGDLKSREFMAKGLPMILGCDIDVLRNVDYPYAIQFRNDDSPINIEKVISFYDELIQAEGAENLRKKIRESAWKLVDINSTYQPVTQCVNELLYKST